MKKEIVFQLLAENNLLAPFCDHKDIGRCVQVAKIFKKMGFQFHSFPTVTHGAMIAWDRRKFVSWKEIHLSKSTSYTPFVDYMFFLQQFLEGWEDKLSWMIPPWETIHISCEFSKELCYEEMDILFSCFHILKTKLKSVVVDFGNCSDECCDTLQAFSDNMPFW